MVILCWCSSTFSSPGRLDELVSLSSFPQVLADTHALLFQSIDISIKTGVLKKQGSSSFRLFGKISKFSGLEVWVQQPFQLRGATDHLRKTR
jgi:hypothetical protein